MSIKTLQTELKNLKDKRVLLRLDLNEEIDARGKLVDNFRIESALLTIRKLVKAGAKIIIASHLGRPEGKWDKALSLKPIAECLAECLKYKFVETEDSLPSYKIPHVILFKKPLNKRGVAKLLGDQSAHDIVMLENIRFYEGEDNNSPEFAELLSKFADYYVNDAFSVTHHPASSIVAITKRLPSSAGPLLEKEIKSLDHVLNGNIRKPFVLVMGGIKIEDKAKTLRNLSRRADKVLLGGGLANLFLCAQGYDIGKNNISKASLAIAKELLLNLKSKLILPADVVVLSSKSATKGKAQAKKITDVGITDQIFDIGPQTILSYSKELKQAGTICWNGPLGYFEDKKFRAGTMSLAKVVGGLGKRKAYALAGGGETVAAIRLAGQLEHFDHISTGGGAMLEYLAGEKLPGIEALKK
ncbi:phosphoglycerate kinase [bacterium]|nr:MAG: phosphoglycerate kinase [bacterium]